MVQIILLVMDGLKLLRLFHLLLVHDLSELWILRHLSSLTMDIPKLLQDFEALVSSLLLCVKSAKVRAPFLDQMILDSLHCNSMASITPPPELLTYSDLEDFLSAQRVQPLLLLRVRLLDFVCTPKSAISSELYLLEYFSVTHVSCVSGITSNSDRRSMVTDGSQKLQGPNMCAIYQRVRPPQSGKCSLDSSLTRIIDLPARRYQ
jgi:hypothetical protein